MPEVKSAALELQPTAVPWLVAVEVGIVRVQVEGAPTRNPLTYIGKYSKSPIGSMVMVYSPTCIIDFYGIKWDQLLGGSFQLICG